MASTDIADDIRKWVNKCSLGNDRFKTPHFKGKIINNVPALKKLGKQLMRLEEFAFDVETTGLRVKYKYPEGDKIVGMAISWGREHTYYIPIFHEEYLDECLPEKIVTKYLKPVFEREDVTLIGHNPIFDLHVLCNMGINVVTPYIFDTMIACWMINENVLKKLENLVKHYYGYNKYDLKQVLTTVPLSLRKEYGYSSTDFCCSISEIPILGLYCMEDTYWSWKIHVDVLDELEEQKLETFFYEKYMYFNQVIFNMERRGVKVDIPALKKMQKMAEKDLEDLQYQIYELAGIEFNVNSNDQLRELLYGYKKYAPVYEEVKEYQYDANGEPVYYKSGKNKGEQKFKLKKNKDKIVGEKFTGNQHILDVSFCFPVLAKTETGLPKTDMDTFEKILEKEYKKDKRKQEGQELLELLIKHSKLSTLKGTFMDGMLAEIYPDGKIHTGYAICGCVVGDTLIPTDKGIFEIENLVGDTEEKFENSSVKIFNRYRELEDTSYGVSYNQRDTIRLKTLLGLEIEGTLNHPLISNSMPYVFAKRNTFFKTGEWKKLEDIRVGDYVAVMCNYHVFAKEYKKLDLSSIKVTTNTNAKQVTYPTILDETLAEFLGIYYADGSIHNNNGSYSIRITNGDMDVMERVCFLSKNLFGINASVDFSETRSNTMNITAKNLEAFFTYVVPIQRGCVNKIIPDYILESPESVVKAFIKGITLDSSVITSEMYNDKIYLKFTLSNKKSALTLQQLLLNIGIICSVTQDTSKTGNVFNVSIYNEQFIKFCEEIGFIETRKYFSYKPKKAKRNNYLFDEDTNTLWLKVKRIETGKANVYDFNVPNTHSFVSNSFISHNTDSGRLASTEPNLMNLPRPVEPDIDDYEFWAKYEIRNVFIPDSEDEVIQVHDYTNLEAMLQAEYSGDELLIEMFREKYDVHGYTAVKVFKLNCSPNEAKKMYPQKRQLAKSIRFALQYGGTEFAIARNAGISKEEARDSVNDYYNTFKGEAEYKVRQKNFAHRYGFVYSLMGRRRHLEEINSNNYKMVGYLERVALNYPNQSGAADIMITAQLLVEKDERLKKLGYRQIMQVHDELIGIVPKENVEKSIKIVKEIMETCVKLKHVELIADGDYSEVSYAKAK